MKNLGALRQKMPRIMTSDTEEKKDLYRAGMHAELQKFKDTQKNKAAHVGGGCRTRQDRPKHKSNRP